jgi:hypothetical protein
MIGVSDAEIREAMDAVAPPAPVRCYSALGVVTSELHVLQDGDATGVAVDVRIITGPFTGEEVAAMILCPATGETYGTIPIGARVKIDLLDGDLSGYAVVAGRLPGGKDSPIPAAVAGVPVTQEGLGSQVVEVFDKGTGKRFYIRGSQLVFRLKGAQEGFAGEFYIECDDGPAPNNTALRVAFDPTTGKMGIRMRDAAGASVQVCGGAVSIKSPNGKNGLEVSDEATTIFGEIVNTLADNVCNVKGGLVMINMPLGAPPVPVTTGVAIGTTGPANVTSATVHVGP